MQCNKEPSKWIQSEIKEKGVKANKKVKKSKEKMRENTKHHVKLNFVCALVGLRLWRSTCYLLHHPRHGCSFDARCGREREGRVKLLLYEKEKGGIKGMRAWKGG